MSASPTTPKTIDARLRVLYLVFVAVVVVWIKPAPWLAAFFASQCALWLVVGLGPRKLVRQVLKLWGFSAVILLSYALTHESPQVDRWVKLPLGVLSFSINVGGLGEASKFILRVLSIIVGSQIARVGDPRAIAAGLSALRAPRSFTLALDAVLALLGGDGEHGGGRAGGGGGRGRGRGDGSGGGRRRRDAEADSANAPKEGMFAAAKRVAKGDVAPIRERIEHHIARAEAHLRDTTAGEAGAPQEGSRDVATVAGLALTMLGIRALKVLPSINFAPGHKLVLLTPLYIAASMMTRGRFGATLTGLTMGLCAFLLGDGKYGAFELLKHVAPGLVCDLVVPMLIAGPKPAGRLAWSVVGGVTGAVRFAAIFVAIFIYTPALAIAFLVPGFLIHTTFGIVSGYVSQPLVALLMPLAQKPIAPLPAPPTESVSTMKESA